MPSPLTPQGAATTEHPKYTQATVKDAVTLCPQVFDSGSLLG